MTGRLRSRARYESNGSLDTSFDQDGKVTTHFGWVGGSGDDGATGVAMQSDGKIVVAGWSSYLRGYSTDFAMARYAPDGSLDANLGENGKVTTDFGQGREDVASGVVIQLASDVTLSAWLFGGADDDRLKGGTGHDVNQPEEGDRATDLKDEVFANDLDWITAL